MRLFKDVNEKWLKICFVCPKDFLLEISYSRKKKKVSDLIDCWFFFSFLQCSCAGSFEIRLVSLTVDSKEDFPPELRICLKHFERRINYNGECTFGEVILDAERLRNGTKTEFQSGWPVCAYLSFFFLIPTI